MATFTYDWEATTPSPLKFQVMDAEAFRKEFGWITDSFDKGINPITKAPVSKRLARVFKWRIELLSDDEGMTSIWSANWEGSKGKPDGQIYCLRVPRESCPEGLPSDGTGYFSPDLMKYVVINPASYDELKSVGVRLITSELSERSGKYVSVNGSCAEVLGRGVCIMASKGLGKSTHVYGLAGWTEDGTTKFHSDGWLFADVKSKVAFSPEKKHYFKGMPSLSLTLRRILSRSKKRDGESSLVKTVVVMDGFLADPKEFMGKDKFTKKCRLNTFIILKRDMNDQWLIRPLSAKDAVDLLEAGVLSSSGDPYFNPFVIRSPQRDQKRRQMYEQLLAGGSIYLVNARAQPWITQTLIRGLALEEWSWAKLVDGQVYALRGEKYEPLFKVGGEGSRIKQPARASPGAA